MKKTLGFLLLFLGMLFVGETTLARTQVMDANVQLEQGVSLSADEMQSIRGGDVYSELLCGEFLLACVSLAPFWFVGLICLGLTYWCLTA